MYHSFLIHLSAHGHLGCFYILAIINSAVMNIGVHVSLSDLVSLVCMPEVGLLGHMAVLHTYTKTNHHPRANKFQNKTYHANSLATQEHRHNGILLSH